MIKNCDVALRKTKKERKKEERKLNKKAILLALALVLLLCPNGALPVLTQVNNPYELIIATIDFPETVDPAWSYDTASGELIMNVYDTLIRFDGESIDEFVPGLATDWTISEDGLTYTFTIRDDAEWHDPAYGYLTPKDVEYSFERWMIQDRSGGPTWMILEPLFDVYDIEKLGDLIDPLEVETVGQMIDDAVESDATTVTLHLTIPYAPLLTIIAQPWASILSEAWCTDYDDFPGFDDTGYNDWINYHDPEVSPLDDYPPGTGGTVMMGTGPYILDFWETGFEYSLVKFDHYWGGWPAEHPTWGGLFFPGQGFARGYLTRVTVKFTQDWATRKLMFLAGDADIVYVPRMNIYDVFGSQGIRCVYPLPSLTCSPVMFFNFEVAMTSPYEILPPGTIDEPGIPIDFFSDIDVRKAFAYCIDYYEYIDVAFLGEAGYPLTPIIEGLPYRRPPEWYAANEYYLDLAQAESRFRNAWGGEVWENGFTITIAYRTERTACEMLCEMLKDNIERLNPKFHVLTYETDGTTWIQMLNNRELPLFIFGWTADYPDPHYLVHPFMHSTGAFTHFQSITYGESGRKQIAPYGDPTLVIDNEYVANLISEGIKATDPAERQTIYYELQAIYVDEVPSVPLCYPFGRHWERTWVQGWYYNPIFPGFYFYHLWKEDIPIEDLNPDSEVDIFDIGHMILAFGSYYYPGDIHPNWNSRTDLNQDQRVDIFDVVMIAKKFGYKCPPWTPP